MKSHFFNKPFISFSLVGEHQLIENERGREVECHAEGRLEQLKTHLQTPSWPLPSLPHLESFLKWVSKQGQCPRVWDSARMKSEHSNTECGAYRTWCLTCTVSERQGGFPRAIGSPLQSKSWCCDSRTHLFPAHCRCLPSSSRAAGSELSILLPQGIGQERFRSARPVGGPFST